MNKKHLNKYLKILIPILLLLLTVFYTYYFSPLVDDELYNYGFSYSVVKGLVPYKDFNMIIPPLFCYLLAGLLKIFGAKLLIYHILLAFLIVSIFTISYKIIGIKALIIYLLLLIYPYAGYNIFALLLLFILFYFYERKNKKIDVIEPILISLMFLTKQTLGLLIIPSLLYSKNKKKTILIYLVFTLAFLLYLISNGNIVEFFDYCLFGMFDFANKNSTGIEILTIIEIIIIGVLVYLSFKTKKRDIGYCLIFQIMAFPIVNYIHFLISFIPVVYLFIKHYNNNRYVSYFSFITIITFFLTFNIVYWLKGENYLIASPYKENTFMENRVTYTYMNKIISEVEEYKNIYPDHTLYTFGTFSYLIKLNLDIPINKYDLINNGNMGYNGANRYLEEIDNHCSKNKCIFIINDFEREVSKYVQTNQKILDYVKENYRGIYNSNVFSIYIN